MLSASLAVLGLLLLLRFGLSVLARRMALVRRVLVIGDGPRAVALRSRLARHDSFRPLSSMQARIWGIIVAEDVPNVDVLWDVKLRGVPVYDDVMFEEHHLGRIALDAVDENWLLFGNMLRQRFVQRLFDIVLGSVLTILSLPLMILMAILIKLDSRGPILYVQDRVGLHGKPFILLKFRSMRQDAEASGIQWASKGDSRITRIGKFMRICRIDELPQLINVLRGEMSMIGPRPERPAIVEELSKLIPFYDHRGHVKPGLTGWAQVNYPYGASVEDAREKLAYDLYYIKNRTFGLDLSILFATVRVILLREGAR